MDFLSRNYNAASTGNLDAKTCTTKHHSTPNAQLRNSTFEQSQIEGKLDPKLVFEIGSTAVEKPISLEAQSTKSSTDTTLEAFMKESSYSLGHIMRSSIVQDGSKVTSHPYLQSIAPVGTVIHLAYNKDATKLAVSAADGNVRILNTARPVFTDSEDTEHHAAYGSILNTLIDDEVLKPRPSSATATKWCPGRTTQVISAYAKGVLKYWHTTSGNCLHTIDTDGKCITSISHDPFSAKFAASADTQVFIYDEQEGRIAMTLGSSVYKDRVDGHNLKVFQVLYHPNQAHILYSGGWDNTVQIWDDRTKNSVKMISGPHVCGQSMDVDPLNNHLLVGSWRRESNIQVFDLKTLELIKEIDQFGQLNRNSIPFTRPYAARFFGQNHIVVCGTHQSLLKIYNKKDFSLSGCFPASEPTYCMDLKTSRPDVPIAVGSGRSVYFLDWNGLSSSKEAAATPANIKAAPSKSTPITVTPKTTLGLPSKFTWLASRL